MADISVSYDLSYSPNPVGVDLNLSISNNQVNVSLQNVPTVFVTALPHYSADIASDILSTVATPMANAISVSLGLFASNILSGVTFGVFTIPNMNFNIASVNINVNPSNLNMSNYNGMLMVNGDISIS